MRLTRLALFLFALLVPAFPAGAVQQMVHLGDLDVAVWAPEETVPGRWPVVIFSHGFHGCATQSRFLMDAFAKDGYIVFAPNHKDATCAGGKASWIEKSPTPFGKPDDWTTSSFRDRGDDIQHLIESLKASEKFRDRIDWDRFGLIGHSLGGYTVLALGGAWPEWKLPGVRAILALSPYSQPFIRQQTLSGLEAPVMYQGGTRDFGVTPALRKSEGAYEQSPLPKYYVEFARAGHFAWANRQSSAHDNIELYSLAFMNHYVKGEPADPVLTEDMRGVSALRYESELGNKDNLNMETGTEE